MPPLFAESWTPLAGGAFLDERCLLAALTAFAVSLAAGPWTIRRLARLRAGQVVRDDGPRTHLRKAGTPTMGGILIVLAILIASLLWVRPNLEVAVLLLGLVGFAGIGLLDDALKLRRRHSRGIGARFKFVLQALLALIVVILLDALARPHGLADLIVPFDPGVRLDPGVLAVPLAWFVVVGTSNAVNLTDGLDGQAALQTALIVSALGALAYVLGHPALAGVLRLGATPALRETAVVAAATAGAGLGFLWYNGHPAQIFMGDVGALGLGAVLGILAVESGTDLLLFLMGGVLVAETLSVVAQVVSFKTTGRRVLRMAPLHHHFELGGWAETKVVVRFALVTLALILLVVVGLRP